MSGPKTRHRADRRRTPDAAPWRPSGAEPYRGPRSVEEAAAQLGADREFCDWQRDELAADLAMKTRRALA